MLDEKAITSGTLSQRRLAWSSPIRKRPNCSGALASRLVGHVDRAGIQRHRDREQLEQRAELVGAERDAVEQRVGRRLLVAVGVEIGQADAGQDLAARDVEHDRGGALGGEARARRLELAAHHLLNPEIEGQHQRRLALVGIGQAVIEAALDAGEPLVLDPDVADQMRGQRALRVDPVALGAKADAGQPEPDHRPLLVVGDVALEPDEAARLLEPGEQIRSVAALERAGERCRRRLRVEHQGGIGIDRGRRVVGREQSAVAVDDVGAMPAVDRVGVRLSADPGIATPERQIDQPQRQRQQSEREQRRRPGAAGAGRDAGRNRPRPASGLAPRRLLSPGRAPRGQGPGRASRSGGLSRSGISPPDGSSAVSGRFSSSRSERSGTSVIRTIWPGCAGCSLR